MSGDKKVFVIENEFTKKVSLPEKLKKEGFDVQSGGGEGVVGKIVSQKPDLIITFVDKNAALGKETQFIEELKSKPELKESEIFVCAENISVGLEVQLRRLKLNNYFQQDEDTGFLVKSVVTYFNPEQEDMVDPFEYTEPAEPVYAPQPPAEATVARKPAPPPPQTDEERFGEMFGEFSDKVHEQLGDKDGETYYNLGVSYMDMGLHKEAIKEFLLAAKDEQFKLESTSMMGICLRSLGKLAEAISAFQQGTKMSKDPVEIMGFRYEIGITLQEMGKLKEAFNFLAAVFKVDKTYRDARKRLVDIKSSLQAQKG